MTSVTYGHGYLTDCDDKTGWTEDSSPTLTNTSPLVVEHGDYFRLNGTATAENQSTYWEYDLSTNLSSDVYTRSLVRCKTSTDATGLQGYVRLEFTSGFQVVLPLTFSTVWTVVAEDITSGKTIDKVRFYAFSDAACSGEYVLYDFLLLHKDTFTLPNETYGKSFTPPSRDVFLAPPSRIGDITQHLGAPSASFRTSCDLDTGKLDSTSAGITGTDWKRPQGVNEESETDYMRGQVFLDIVHNSKTEPFQWLNTETQQFKATLNEPQFREEIREKATRRILDLTFREYRLSDATNETYVERFGLNL